MNEKGFAFYEEKIRGKDLIIENAGQLKNELIDDIEEFIINKKGKTLFALVDVINNFDKLATERPSFVGRFDIYSVLSSRPQESLEASQEEIEEYKGSLKGDSEKGEIKDRVATPKNPPEHQMNLKNEKISGDKRNIVSVMSVDEFVEECKKYAEDIDCVISSDAIPALYEKAEEMRESKMPLNKENAEALIEEVADRAEKPKMFKKPKYDKEGCLILSEEHFNF